VKRSGVSSVLVVCSLVWFGCSTSPGNTTAVSAATGGVIGAGLGAIVGSQTGDPGAGVAIGAVAGSSAGALVGNTIEGQERDIARQSELIRKQEAAIMAHRSELERLRRELGDDDFGEAKGRYGSFTEQDVLSGASNTPEEAMPGERGVAFRDRLIGRAESTGATGSAGVGGPLSYSHPRANLSASVETPRFRVEETNPKLSASHPLNRYPKMKAPQAAKLDRSGERLPTVQKNSTQSAKISATKSEKTHDRQEEGDATRYVSPRLAAQQSAESIPSVEEKAVSAPTVVAESGTAELGAIGQVEVDEQCSDAATEVAKAEDSDLSADKLFHLRRALRLCPNNSAYHVALASLYKKLGRAGDAAYEFHEALRIDPNNPQARASLKELGSEID
jgi:hypothetical protein